MPLCVGAVLLAYWALRALSAFRPPLPIAVTLDVSLDPTVLVFALALSLIAGLGFGLLPALQASRLDLVSGLRDDTAAGSARLRRLSLRNLLLVGQVAVSVVLVVGAGLFLRSVQRASGVDLGFDPENVAVMNLDLTRRGFSPEAGRQFYRDLTERLEAVAGVDAVSLAREIPLSLGPSRRTASVEGYEPSPGEDMAINFNTVSPGYFGMLRMSLVRGRAFTDADRGGTALVSMVNETFARRFWPGEDPVGRRLSQTADPDRMTEVIGVVRDGHYVTLGEDRPYVWLPLYQGYEPVTMVHVRGERDVETLFSALVHEVTRLDDQVSMLNLTLMERETASQLLPQRIGSTVLSLAGVVGLFLAAVGIYGVVAYAVSQRTRELGIRIALGAKPRVVIWRVINEGLLLASVGLAVGLGVVFGTTRLIAALLYEISPMDAVALGGSVAVIGLAASAASFFPVRRAVRIDPVVALRYE